MMARCVTLIMSLVPLVFASASAVNAAATPVSDTDERPADFPGTPSDWHGFDRYDFEVDGKPVLVVAPEKPAHGRPWVWHGEFFGHKPAPDIALLERGFHVVYMRVPDMLGCPAAVAHWDAFYKELTEKYGFAKKAALVGLSRGGLYCYNWAAANSEKVACIYGDAPVCDFKSWPGGKGKGNGSPRDWKLVLECYGFENEAEALAYDKNPVDNLAPLAAANVPLLHVYGDADESVPWDENTGVVAERYRELGGSIKLIAKPGVGHHPHGLDDPTPIVEFIARHARETARDTQQTPSDDATSQSRPNVILLLADDMGYADPSCFGGTAVATPNLDRLAAEGMTFTQFYAGSAVCTPTRASVLTGRYPLRFDIRRHFPDDESHLPATAVTLPELLNSAGYVTAHVGKWHLGGLHQEHIRDRANSIPGPHQHGFDHYLCQNEEQPRRGELGRERMLYRKGGTCLIRDEKNVPPTDPYYDQHFTDINGNEAVRLIEKCAQGQKPFFLNVWWLVPHTPYEPAPEPFWSRTAAEGISDDQHRFRSMVAHMDHKIGQIVAKLDEVGIRKNTFIFFTSDNGGAYEADIGQLKGGKTDLHEGGIRVPMIASWPGRIPAGTTRGILGHTNDILPTVCAAADVEVPADAQVDGLNLLPVLTGEKSTLDRGTLDRGTVFWQVDLYRHLQRHYPKPKPYATAVARRGRWKLLAMDGTPVELFDLEVDPREEKNQLAEKPHVVAELQKELESFLAAPRDRSGKPAR